MELVREVQVEDGGQGAAYGGRDKEDRRHDYNLQVSKSIYKCRNQGLCRKGTNRPTRGYEKISKK